MATDLTKRKITNLGGKAAVFVRGFIEFCDTYPQTDDSGIPMRKAQEAGQSAVQELGEEISIPYISKLTNLLIASSVLIRERVGKHYRVTGAMNYPWLIEYLENTGWGRSMTTELPIEAIQARSALLDHMAFYGAVRIQADEPLDKAAYQVAYDKFKSGQYDMVFVERDHLISLLPNEWDPGDAIPTMTHASVSDR